ncbi:MAG: hypothetical protein ACRDI2_21640 [Chloroflexota bacterium]
MAPELRRLTGDALLIWGDARERREALAAIVAASDAADPVLQQATVRRIDSAVVEGLQALQLRRELGSEVQVGSFNRGWIGRVTPDGRILFDIDEMRHYVTVARQPDRIFHTWVHESHHARCPASLNRRSEYVNWPGYEEGMAEGLARVVTGTKAGMAVADLSYEYYVQAYRSLAVSAGFDVGGLWRALWLHPPGDVREHLVSIVDAGWRERTGETLNPTQRSRLRAVADRVFMPRRDGGWDSAVLVRLWESVFR